MKHERFTVVISELAPGEAESLRLDLTRAAISESRRGEGQTIMIESRSNAVFSADDVLDVLANWIEKKPDRFATASLTVQRASGNSPLWRFRGIPALALRRRHVAPAPIHTPRRRAIEQQAAN